MADSNITILRVLIASPDDVEAERQLIPAVIDEVNRLSGRDSGVRLEPISWQTDTIPGIGEDAQDVINAQIGDDYDVFIGILWKKFGTPTKGAGSGTEDEFNRAYERHSTNSALVRVAFYFKDAPPNSLAEIDAAEWSKLTSFKSRISSQGVLYREFKDDRDFEYKLRLLLTNCIRWGKTSWGSNKTVADTIPTSPASIGTTGAKEEEPLGASAESQDLGFLELIEITQEEAPKLTSIAHNIAQQIETLGKGLEEGTVQIAGIGQIKRQSDVQAIRSVLAHVVTVMDDFTNETTPLTTDLSSSLSHYLDAYFRLVAYSSEFSADDSTQSEEMIQASRSLLETITTTKDSLVSFRTTVSRTPNVSREFNAARRRLITCLDELINELLSAETSLLAALNSLPE